MGRKDSSEGWRLPGYEHRRLLGTGAGGRVWLAVHSGSGTPVAVKYLTPGLHAAQDFREAYRSEAALLAALDSPHVARLYEYVEGPAGAAIVMEAVEGASLRELIKSEGSAASPEAALSILKGSLLGLAAAHESGVVHRDYKPANVLVTPEGVSKLVDFGIAARSGDPVAAVGTPLYMAPEQFHGAPASPAGDVYAATVTFFECVTGERPFPGANAVELMAQHALGRIPDELAPEPVRGLIRWGMAKSPQDRPGDASLLLHELEDTARAAFGADWEARGRRELATALLALVPLLLSAELAEGAPTSATSFATTAIGSGNGVGVVGGKRHHGSEARRRDGRRRRLRKSIGAGAGALVLVAAAVAAAAASAPHAGSGGSGGAGGVNAADAALTTATTLVTPAAQTDAPPTASPTPSAKASLSPSASATTTSQQSSTPTAAPSSPSPATGTPTRSASPAAPSISGVAITSVYCVGGQPVVDANVTVTSNGAGGSVTFSWFYETASGTAESVGSPATVSLKSGQTQQTVSPPQGVDFSDFEDFYPRWGVQVTSTPTTSTNNSPQLVQTSSNGCGVSR